jgi:type IV pilus assembly protein PilC
MPRYAYKAYTRSGSLVEGLMESPGERDVLISLKRQDLKVLRIDEKKPTLEEMIAGFMASRRRVNATEVARLTQMFATLVSAGIPLSTALRTLEEQAENPALKDVLRNVLQEIESGLDLSSALAKHPSVFDRMYVDLIRAGEASGALHVVLERLADYTEKAEKLRRRVRGALTYPAVIFSIALIIVWVIVVFVVPQFAETFAGAGKTLPMPTQILLTISDLLSTSYYWIAPLLIGAWYGLRALARDPKMSRTLDILVLRIPVFGELIRKAAVARFARTLAMLLVSGVPIIQALQIVSHVTGNRMITEALQAVGDAIVSGESFAEPLKRSGVFSPLISQMVSVGEATGSLAEMLGKVADFYEDEVEVAMETISTLIEPFIIVFLGLVLGFVIIALFLPILTLSEVVPV